MVIWAREGLSSPISLLRRASAQPKQSWTSSYAALFDWSHKRLSLSPNLQYGGVIRQARIRCRSTKQRGAVLDVRVLQMVSERKYVYEDVYEPLPLIHQ